MEWKVKRWRRVLEDRGHKISGKKTGYMDFNGDNEIGDVRVLGGKLKRFNTF